MRTPMTDMLGIDVPLAAFSHCRDVVAAVTNAGGIGFRHPNSPEMKPARTMAGASRADVAGDGSFSTFEGMQRVITVLEGAGMQLSVDGETGGDLRPF